ncbi:DnaJ C-terminal domain-containing protein [Rhodoligotrophos defluvii]|uniref:DnaJ C-terminal domain-containing protein n=1 Tax=Rhodoligotrophos defluvii TaxID=2561934 RepID=UPI0010C95359|nr:J domain-containing protein [Rhodoligotrophos defluvii]
MTAADPYKILGVARDASDKDIQKAYRALAKKHHPDLNPGDAEAEKRFKEISVAYDLLSDPEKRARYDRGEIDASGNEQAQHYQRRYYRDYAGGPDNAYASSGAYADFTDMDDILSAFFSQRGAAGAGARTMNMRGRDVQYRLEVEFLEAVLGGKKRLAMPDGSTIDVTIPPGTRDGQVLRLAGKGQPGIGQGKAGDALVEISVRPHPVFTRDGDDIRMELPVTLKEAVLGGKVRAPTPSGAVDLTLPKWSNTGKVMRLKGKGVPGRNGAAGDLYITLKVVLPDAPDPELEAFMNTWAGSSAQDPRRGMEV